MKKLILISLLAMPFMATGGWFFDELDYSGQDLRGSNFSNSDLRGANFQGADLRGAIFINADLRNAHFEQADLRGAFFRGAILYSDMDTNNPGDAFFKLDLAHVKGAIVNQELYDYLQEALYVKFPADSSRLDMIVRENEQ